MENDGFQFWYFGLIEGALIQQEEQKVILKFESEQLKGQCCHEQRQKEVLDGTCRLEREEGD